MSDALLRFHLRHNIVHEAISLHTLVTHSFKQAKTLTFISSPLLSHQNFSYTNHVNYTFTLFQLMFQCFKSTPVLIDSEIHGYVLCRILRSLGGDGKGERFKDASLCIINTKTRRVIVCWKENILRGLPIRIYFIRPPRKKPEPYPTYEKKICLDPTLEKQPRSGSSIIMTKWNSPLTFFFRHKSQFNWYISDHILKTGSATLLRDGEGVEILTLIPRLEELIPYVKEVLTNFI